MAGRKRPRAPPSATVEADLIARYADLALERVEKEWPATDPWPFAPGEVDLVILPPGKTGPAVNQGRLAELPADFSTEVRWSELAGPQRLNPPAHFPLRRSPPLRWRWIAGNLSRQEEPAVAAARLREL